MFGEGFDRVLAAARRGDDAAWTALYLDVAPGLRGFLIGRGARDPDDVVSETLLQVVRDLHRFDGGEASFRSWAFAIARNRLIDEVRRTDARPSHATDAATLDELAPAVGFEEVAVAHLGVGELEHLLRATTVDQREVLLLRYVADLTLRETAEVLGKRYDAVKALHRRGLDALRDRLAVGSPAREASGSRAGDAAGGC